MTPRRPNLLIGVSLFVSVAIFLISALVLVEMREDALRRSQGAATNLALIVEREISRNLEVYDLSLQAVIDGRHEPGLNRLPPLVRQKVLFDRSASAKDLGALLVVDERGNIVIDSRSIPARRVNVADCDYFKVHLKSPDVGLYVSHPLCTSLGGREATQLCLAADSLIPMEPLRVSWSAHCGLIISVICLTV